MNRSTIARRAPFSSWMRSMGSGRRSVARLVSSRRSSYVLATISRPVETSTILKLART